jgi:elongation factor Ts
MTITADQVKELRERTSAGLMDCKRALTEAGGDFEKAVEILRKKGIASAAKREGREAKEGFVGLKVEGNKGVLVELNCETDFVAKTDAFENLLTSTVNKIFTEGEKVIESESFRASLVEVAAKTGEKLQAKRAATLKVPQGFIASYLHSNRRVGVLVAIETASKAPEAEAAGREVAMQVAAMRPDYVNREEVPSDWVRKEKEIFLEQSKETLQNKPEPVREKILEGKLTKRYEEVCLLDQRFIKDDKQSVRQYLDAVAKKTGSTLKISAFLRYELGASN